jgi:hypothetical protein
MDESDLPSGEGAANSRTPASGLGSLGEAGQASAAFVETSSTTAPTAVGVEVAMSGGAARFEEPSVDSIGELLENLSLSSVDKVEVGRLAKAGHHTFDSLAIASDFESDTTLTRDSWAIDEVFTKCSLTQDLETDGDKRPLGNIVLMVDTIVQFLGLVFPDLEGRYNETARATPSPQVREDVLRSVRGQAAFQHAMNQEQRNLTRRLSRLQPTLS